MDFEKKHQEDLQRLRGFRLLDGLCMISAVQMQRICIIRSLQTVSGILRKMREEWRLCVVKWKS